MFVKRCHIFIKKASDCATLVIMDALSIVELIAADFISPNILLLEDMRFDGVQYFKLVVVSMYGYDFSRVDSDVA